jgi:hypothetical protein
VIAGEHHFDLEVDLLALGQMSRPLVAQVIARLSARAS